MNRPFSLIFSVLLSLAPLGRGRRPGGGCAGSRRSQRARRVYNRDQGSGTDRYRHHPNRIYFFTELRGLAGQTVTHRGLYRGKTMSEESFQVGGPRWRVWSRQDPAAAVGEWQVEVVDGAGTALGKAGFTYGVPQGTH